MVNTILTSLQLRERGSRQRPAAARRFYFGHTRSSSHLAEADPLPSQAFVQDLLSLDPNANLIVGGDCNEYVQTRAVFAPFAGLLTELDEASGVPAVERYTYLFDQNSQQLDHLFVSSAIVQRGTAVEHVHVNNWAESVSKRASDHDPSVAQVQVC